MSLLTLEAKLERQDPSTPWGFRMQGGKDFSSALAIARVTPGSLAAKCGLQQGDVILKIGSKSSDTLKHKDAQDVILSYGNKLDLLLQRIREKKRTQNGFGGGAHQYDKFSTPNISSSYQPVNAPGSQANSNYNTSAKPFGSSAPSKPAAYSPADMNRPADYSKYADVDEKPGPGSHQSRSFKFLSDTLESGQDPPSSLKPTVDLNRRSPSPQPVAGVTSIKSGTKQFNNPMGLYSASIIQTSVLSDNQGTNGTAAGNQNPTEVREYDEFGKKIYRPSETFKLIQEQETEPEKMENKDKVPQEKSRTIRALEKQLGEEPGTKNEDIELPDTIVLPESETLRLIKGENSVQHEPYIPEHSPSFKQLERQLGETTFNPVSAPVKAPAAPKPGVWSPGQGSQTPAAKPFNPNVGSSASAPAAPRAPPSKPTGVGAVRGKIGDAVIQTGDPGAGTRIPICAGCGTAIRGPFVLAMKKSWCPDHFVCANPRCGVKLLDIGFIEEGGFLYCEKDYELYFAPHCAKCDGAIIGECVNALNKQYHPACFLCFQCKQPIGGGQFHLEDGNAYCENDWRKMFQTMCSACNFPIEPGDKWVEALSSNFHSECFNCSTCQVNLEGQPFFAKAGKPYCKKHAK